ncbi:MAG: zinc metallopeptidase [Clostridia bacterium]|nr:zinc metallopeptidase [Clostridia bacterium]
MLLYYILYYGTFIIIVPGLLLAIIAQIAIKVNYKRYSKVDAKSGWTAEEMSEMFAERYDMNGVTVQPIKGDLTDNYNPSTDVLSLSESVYGKSSVAALGVAAHECGHAAQQHSGSILLRLRTILVPVTNIGSKLAVPVAVVGLIISWLATNSDAGWYVVCVGIALYSLATIFALITLPVEFNASHRGLKMLREQAVLDDRELKKARKVLTCAALTYVASFIVTFLYLLRFIVIMAGLSGKKRK